MKKTFQRVMSDNFERTFWCPRIRHSSKNELVCSFFGRIPENYLTFSGQVNLSNNKPLNQLISCVKTLYNLLNIVSCVPRSLEDIDDK